MKKLAPIFLLLLWSWNGLSYAKTCRYKADTSTANLYWTAYKLTEKMGVKGTFLNKKYRSAPDFLPFAQMLRTLKVSINATSVDAGNPARNLTIGQFFFGRFSNKMIDIKVQSVEGNEIKGKLHATIAMNGVKRKVPFSYLVKDGRIQIESKIDVLRFKTEDPFRQLSAVCRNQHTGKDGQPKLWPDVLLQADMRLLKKCAVKK